MRKILLPILFLLLLATAESHAIIIPTPFVTQTQYRWRNDDGNETAATWKAAVNTPITVGDTVNTIRVRIELNNNSGGGNMNINETLEYSSNGGGTWTAITNAPTNAFKYVSSTLVTNGGATTNLMGTVTAGTFVAGRIISAVPSATPLSLGANKTEFEWVIKPTGSVLPMTTYTFRSAAQGSTPLVYPTLNTTCVGLSVASKVDSNRCGPGEVVLQATGSAGTTIKWFSSPSGGTELGSGSTFTTPALTTSTNFYASATVGTCASPRVAVTATIKPLPVVNIGDDASFCEGSSYTINAGNFSAYLWDNGSTGQTRTVNTPGTYHVTVTGTGGCKGKDTINLSHYPNPVVNLGNDTSICAGQTLTLDAGNPGMSYFWSSGETTQTIVVNQTNDYSVKVTNELGCSYADTINLIVKEAPLGNINAVHGYPGTYTFNALNPQYAVNYIWNFGDGSPEEEGYLRHHTYKSNGIYLVTLVLVGSCDSNATRSRTVDVFDAAGTTGVNNVNTGNKILMYPNPAKALLTIESQDGVLFKNIAVYNILGQKLKSEISDSRSQHVIRINDLVAGIYTLRIETDKGAIVRKFEVTK